jgi:geranylgeranyl pyrophosphate synthase
LTKQFTDYLKANKFTVEAALRENLPVTSLPGAQTLNEALEYAVFPGGKRLRPFLTLLAADLARAPRHVSLPIACATEFLHCSSLILDDLPAMDDALIRRHRETLHLVFGEGMAVLAAIALLNHSYALFAQAGGASLVAEASSCIGTNGMIGGQAIDLQAQRGTGDANILSARDLKTVGLMRLMMTAGAIACGAGEHYIRALAEFGECYGEAYQLRDDLIDGADCDSATGKTLNQDARHLRVTAISAFGFEETQNRVARLLERGLSSLFETFGERSETLMLREATHLTHSTPQYSAARV